MKIKKLPKAIIIAVALIACVGVSMAVSRVVFSGSNRPSERLAQNRPLDERMLYTIKKDKLPMEIDVDGISEPYQATTLSFFGEGIVTGVYKQEGDYVKKGEVIAELDANAARLKLLQVEKDLEQARVTGSKRDVEIQTLTKEIALSDLEHTKLIAPYNGYLAAFDLHVNDKVSAATEVGTFYDLSRLEAKLDINEMDINKVAIGNDVEVTFNALPTETFTGKLGSITRKYEDTDGIISFKATAIFENLPPTVKPGFNFSGKIIYGVKDNTIIIPKLSLTQEGRRYYVSLVKQGQTEKRYVKIGMATDSYYEVLDGLQEGEKILKINIPGGMNGNQRNNQQQRNFMMGGGGFRGPNH